MNLTQHIKSFFGALIDGGKSQSPNLNASFNSAKELNLAVSERRRLRGIKREQENLVSVIEQEINEISARRVELLTESLVEDDGEKSATASELANTIDAKRLAMKDASSVAEAIGSKISAMEPQLDELERIYKRDLGMFLNNMFSSAAEEYTRKANELAELVFQVGAIQDVMMHYKAGNSNGFYRQIHIPSITPGTAIKHEPIIDTDYQDISNWTKKYKDEIIESLVASGLSVSPTKD